MSENSFTAVLTGSLRRAGLQGPTVIVALGWGGLRLTGEGGGQLVLPRAAIAQLRFERVEGKGYSVYAGWLLREGETRPLKLLPVRGAEDAYGLAMRALAAELAHDGRGERVWVGASKASALVPPGVPIVLAVPAAVLLASERVAWWEWTLVAVGLAAMFAFLAWYAAVRLWPRPLTEEAQLNRYLPPLRSR